MTAKLWVCWCRYSPHMPWQRVCEADGEEEGHVILALHLRQRDMGPLASERVLPLGVHPDTPAPREIAAKAAGYRSLGNGV